MILNPPDKAAHTSFTKNILTPARWRPENNLLYQCLEPVLVTVAAISLIVIADRTLSGPGSWLVVPGILAAAALVPAAIRKNKLTDIGLNLKQSGSSLRWAGITCLVVLPATYIGLYLLRRWGITAPLIPRAPAGPWLPWLLYQIMYVAVAEELFFRGYLLSGLLRPASTTPPKDNRLWSGASVIISAAAFALAHLILTQNALSALTFLPGVVLGWLFLRTRSLLAPIVFHAAANIAYALMTAGL